MIYDKRNNVLIREVSDFDKLPDIKRAAMMGSQNDGSLAFSIPFKSKLNNRERQVYKIGFLSEFLKKLYPDKTFNAICGMLSDNYDIFLSRRQIDRNVKRYLEKKT